MTLCRSSELINRPPFNFIRSAGGQGASASNNFSTTFASVENPLSEGGIWTNGLADGTDWSNARATANGAVGASDTFYLTQRYADCLAHLKTTYRTFNANQFAQGTVYRAGGYTGNGGSHEIELLLHFAISSGVARGYELLWSTAGHMALVRWNGSLGDYTALVDGITAPGQAADGDVVRVEISGMVFTAYKNGSPVSGLTAIDIAAIGGTQWTTGQPGLGFWPVDGAIATSYGWKNFQAGDL